MAPAVVIELSQQVLAGTIEPDDALRRLVVAPFSAFLTGHPELTGNPAIDAVFTNDVRQPVFDALVNNLPAPVGQADGLIDTIDDGVTRVATDIPNAVGPSAPQSSVGVAGSDAQTTDEADTETSPAQVQPEDDSKNLVGDTKAPRLNRPPSVGPGGLVDRVTKTINDFGNTITNLTGGGGPKPGQDAGSSAGSAGVSTGKAGSSAGGTGSSPGNQDGDRHASAKRASPVFSQSPVRESPKTGPESAGADPTVRTVDGCRGSSQCSTGEAADQESAARASSHRAGRHELHHHLAYGGTQ